VSEYNIEVYWRSFPLHPDTPKEGLSLEALFRTTPQKIQAMVKNLQETAAHLGLPFGDRINTYNSRLAQELGKWAAEKGYGDSFHHQAFRAYFGDGLNLATRKALLHIARQSGLPEDEAAQIIEERKYRQPVDDDWREARNQAVTAVPTFIMPQGRLIGAQGFDTLVRFVVSGGAMRRSATAA